MSALPSWVPSWPYNPQKTGYWSPVTSTINWCEEDYYATHYAAEIVNTLTNLFFMGLAFRGIHNVLKYGHDRVFLVTFIGYLLVGAGSFAFHATLTYPMQLVDELSMIYSTCIMGHAVFSYNRSTAFSVFLGFAFVGLAAFITIYYHFLQDPTFHQISYAILTAVVLFRSLYLMETNLRPSLRGRSFTKSVAANGHASAADSAEQARRDARDMRILKTMWVMFGYGLTIFLGGFAIWNLDNAYCSNIRRWRHQVGLPWGLILEGHGWWHVMTGTGAYFYIVWGIWLRHCLNGRQDEFELHWPRLVTSIPSVVRARQPPSSNTRSKTGALANGKKTK